MKWYQIKYSLTIAVVIILASFLTGCTSTTVKKDNTQADSFANNEEMYVKSMKKRLVSEERRLIEIQVSLSKWMHLPELRDLIKSSNAPRITMLHASSSHKGADNYDGGALQMTIPLARMNLDPIEVKRYIEDVKSWGAVGGDKYDEMLRNGVDQGVWTYSFVAYGAANEILEWWNQHPEDIRIVQLILTPIERAQSTFLPDEEI